MFKRLLPDVDLGPAQKGAVDPNTAVPADRLESLLCAVESGLIETGKTLSAVNANVADMKQAVVEAVKELSGVVADLSTAVKDLRQDANANTEAGVKAARAVSAAAGIVAGAAHTLEEGIRDFHR